MPPQLLFSFSKYVDWGAHFGGTIQGVLSGVLVLTRELDNVYSKVCLSPHLPPPVPLTLPRQWGLRLLSLFLLGLSFGWALYTMLHNMHPSRANFELYEENDDWGH
jgi:hypothetical protein